MYSRCIISAKLLQRSSQLRCKSKIDPPCRQWHSRISRPCIACWSHRGISCWACRGSWAGQARRGTRSSRPIWTCSPVSCWGTPRSRAVQTRQSSKQMDFVQFDLKGRLDWFEKVDFKHYFWGKETNGISGRVLNQLFGIFKLRYSISFKKFTEFQNTNV